jgi:hypothetical protein
MALTVYTSHVYKYNYHDGVDITRSGVTKARKAGEPTPGEIWAPSAELVYPAVKAMAECRALMKVGTGLAAKDYVLQQASEKARLNGYRKVPHEVHPTAQREAAFDKMHAALEQTITIWGEYVTAFMLEMRHSWKANRVQ